MSFKLIARDNKINIYDPYTDKYHVIEDDEELSKILDSDGKLLPDEQIRQYFASKESKSRKIQKGFITKKANLKKEYADVEKQTFKDVVKSKIFKAYPNISNEDITAFNKNPTIATIKGFKHLDTDQKNQLVQIFKDNESSFNQELQDKNSLTSLILELQKMNSLYINNGAAMNKARIALSKAKVAEIAELENDDDKIAKIEELKQEIVTNPSSTIEEVEAVKKLNKDNIGDYNKELDKFDDIYTRDEEALKQNKWLFIENANNKFNNEITRNDGKSQFISAVKMNNYSMEPLHKLYKNLKYIQLNKDVLNDIDIDESNASAPKISIKFGDNDEYVYNYQLNTNTPYAKLLVDATKSIKSDISDNLGKKTGDILTALDSAMNDISYKDYDKIHKSDIDNTSDVDVNVEHIEDDSKLAKFILDKKSLDSFPVDDFEQYMKSNEFKSLNLEPYVHFKEPKYFSDIDDLMIKGQHHYKEDINPIIENTSKQLTEQTMDKIIDDYIADNKKSIVKQYSSVAKFDGDKYRKAFDLIETQYNQKISNLNKSDKDYSKKVQEISNWRGIQEKDIMAKQGKDMENAAIQAFKDTAPQKIKDIYSYTLYRNMFKPGKSAENLITSSFKGKIPDDLNIKSNSNRYQLLQSVPYLKNLIYTSKTDKPSKSNYFDELSNISKYVPYDEINDGLVAANKQIVDNLKVGYAHMPYWSKEGLSDKLHSSSHLKDQLVYRNDESEYYRAPSSNVDNSISKYKKRFPIQSDVYYHYMQNKYMSPDTFFGNGQPKNSVQRLRDMLILKLNA